MVAYDETVCHVQLPDGKAHNPGSTFLVVMPLSYLENIHILCCNNYFNTIKDIQLKLDIHIHLHWTYPTDIGHNS